MTLSLEHIYTFFSTYHQLKAVFFLFSPKNTPPDCLILLLREEKKKKVERDSHMPLIGKDIGKNFSYKSIDNKVFICADWKRKLLLMRLNAVSVAFCHKRKSFTRVFFLHFILLHFFFLLKKSGSVFSLYKGRKQDLT